MISSNNDKLNSYLSLGYYNEEGIFKKDDFTRYTLRINLEYEVRRWLNIGVNSQLTYFDQNRVPSSMLTQAMTYIPLGTPYNENGEINLFPVSGDAQRLSPLANYASDNKAVDNTIALRSFNTAYMVIKPTEQLR